MSRPPFHDDSAAQIFAAERIFTFRDWLRKPASDTAAPSREQGANQGVALRYVLSKHTQQLLLKERLHG